MPLKDKEKRREYVKEAMRKWREKNRERERAKSLAYYWKRKKEDPLYHSEKAWREHLWRYYRIRPAEYHAIFEKQGRCCAICKSETTNAKRPRRFAVDHCHKLNKVRGLLCDRCNRGLGLFGDNVELMETAIRYLATWESEQAKGERYR